MTPERVRWMLVGFWLVMLQGSVSLLIGEVGPVRAILLTLLILASAQMGYGVLCRRTGRASAGMILRLAPLLLMPLVLFRDGLASDVPLVVVQACNLVATRDWSDDDIGGWGRRRWAQVRQAGRRFSRPVMGGVVR